MQECTRWRCFSIILIGYTSIYIYVCPPSEDIVDTYVHTRSYMYITMRIYLSGLCSWFTYTVNIGHLNDLNDIGMVSHYTNAIGNSKPRGNPARLAIPLLIVFRLSIILSNWPCCNIATYQRHIAALWIYTIMHSYPFVMVYYWLTLMTTSKTNNQENDNGDEWMD